MLNQIEARKSKISLFFVAFLVSSCANSKTTKMPVEQGYCQLIKETINFDMLQLYYHIDTFPDRSPLTVVVEKENVNCNDLVKFGKPVRVVDRIKTTSAGDEMYLKFTKVDMANSTALVNFEYSPEGIRGEISFKKHNSRWVVVNSNIVEM